MLVLSRKRWEQIVVGSDIRITVLKLEGSHVRIGIEAPKEMTILRAELVDGEPVHGPARVPHPPAAARPKG